MSRNNHTPLGLVVLAVQSIVAIAFVTFVVLSLTYTTGLPPAMKMEPVTLTVNLMAGNEIVSTSMVKTFSGMSAHLSLGGVSAFYARDRERHGDKAPLIVGTMKSQVNFVITPTVSNDGIIGLVLNENAKISNDMGMNTGNVITRRILSTEHGRTVTLKNGQPETINIGPAFQMMGSPTKSENPALIRYTVTIEARNE